MDLHKPDIVETATALGRMPEHKSGSRYYGGICPAGHESKGNRCFNVYADTQSFYCFHCGIGGDVFDLIKASLSCDFSEALEWAKANNLINGNFSPRVIEKKRVETGKADLRLFCILTEAARFWHSQLSGDLRKHLRAHYGLTDKIIDALKIGFAPANPKDTPKHLQDHFTVEQIKKTGILTKRDESFFQGQIIFPYWKNGFVRYLIARKSKHTPEWKQGKYEKLPVYDPESRPFISEAIQNGTFYGEDSINDESYLYIAEGVTDCITLLQHGLPAISPVTTQFRKSDVPKIADLAQNKRVYLIPDNEVNGAGLKGAETTKEALTEKGIEAFIVKLPRPDNQDKIDLNEFVRDHGIERFRELVKEQTPPTLSDLILKDTEFSALRIPEKKSLLHPWLKEKTYGMISGDRGTGKTFCAMSIMDAITNGRNFGPWEAGEPVNCLFVDGEMVASDIQERLKGLKSRERKACLYVYNNEYANLAGLPTASLLSDQWRKQIKEILLKLNIKLWAVDNLSSLAPGIDENVKHEFDPINQFFIQLRYLGISTMLIHHNNKMGIQRGSIGKEDNMDFCIQLQRPPNYNPEDGARFVTNFTKARIPSRDLAKVTDYEFQLIADEAGCLEWTYRTVKENNKAAILQLLNDGVKPKAISEDLGVSEAYISKVKKKATIDGHLTSDGKFTAEGERKFG